MDLFGMDRVNKVKYFISQHVRRSNELFYPAAMSWVTVPRNRKFPSSGKFVVVLCGACVIHWHD